MKGLYKPFRNDVPMFVFIGYPIFMTLPYGWRYLPVAIVLTAFMILMVDMVAVYSARHFKKDEIGKKVLFYIFFWIAVISLTILGSMPYYNQ